MGCINSKEGGAAQLSRQQPQQKAPDRPSGGSAGGGSRGPKTSTKEDLIELQLSGKRGKRDNVIAVTNFDEDFDIPVIEKPKEYCAAIEACVKSPDAFFFTGIRETEISVIVNAMAVMEVSAGQTIINKGDAGDAFYIVASGNYTASIDGKNVKNYGPKQFFGELALAYNKPRAATVTANSAGVLLSLDAKVFRRVIAQSARSRYDDIYEALKKVHLLWDSENEERSNLNESQLAKIAEIVEVVHYKAGTTIIKKGEAGKIFYMIKEGTTVVTELASGKPMADGTLVAGAYFGEQALMSDAPRNATIVAKTDVTLLCLSRELFQSVLGPLKEVMDHNSNMRLLDTVFLFQAGLTNKEKELVYKSFTYEVAKKGTPIVHEGDQGNKFYILKEGHCDVISESNGKTGELEKGMHFGEFALMDDIPRMATIMPTCDCELLSMDRETFTKMISIKDMKKNLDKAKAQLMEENKNKKNMHATNFKFDELKQLAVLGSGTFGRVTLVQHRKTKETYALKAMLKSEIVAHKQQKNVMHEKNVMITCNNPFVLRLFQTFKDQYKLYMLLEFVQGGELFSVLHPAHPPHGVDGVPDRAAKFYTAGVLIGLSYLHNERNVAYRDMKPENCLIDHMGYPKLVDFGFAKVITSKSYTLCGTPEYLAPELVLGRGHNKAVDYWALGIMIYEMQSGYSPFSDQNGMDQVVICKNIVKGNLKFEPTFNPECRDLVKKLLNRDAQSRLGNLKNGTDDIKNHKWFGKYDWKAYSRKEVPVPFVPKISSAVDTSHFDPYAVDDHVEDRSYKDKTDWAKDF